MVRRGLASSRDQARAAIQAGRVLVGGAPATKGARLVGDHEPIRVLGPAARFVSRGGEKLDAALDHFGVVVAGRRVIDAGASTGGFTDCLLHRGAREVIAVDVGHGQLHEKLRSDPRVTSLERTNIRTAGPEVLGPPGDMVVADLSFISLRTVVDALLAATAKGGDLVLLVKPQFEAGRAEASRGRGVITDREVWRRVLREVGAALAGRRAAIMGVMVSPLRGPQGNVEFLLHATVTAAASAEAATAPPDLAELIEQALADVGSHR